MRRVKVTPETVDVSWTELGGFVTVDGIDMDSSELVTFRLPADTASAMLDVVARTGSAEITLADYQVLYSEPTRGDWDSPGTSEE